MLKEKKNLFLIISLAIVLILSACGQEKANTDVAQNAENYKNADLLVDTEWLEANLENENLQVVDMRTENFDAGHIPGAVNIQGWQSLVDPDHEFAGILVGPDIFSEMMGQLGIDLNSTVVVYDDGNNLNASRLFYALEHYGHNDVKLLNGGWTAWLNDGKDIANDPVTPAPKNFEVRENEDVMCSLEEVTHFINDEQTVIIDSRSVEEYTGENKRENLRGGHIPGAINIEWTQNLAEGAIPYFKPASELYNMYQELGVTEDKNIVSYCQTNVRGSHTYFALRLLGYADVAAYEGSWSEYGNLEGTSIDN